MSFWKSGFIGIQAWKKTLNLIFIPIHHDDLFTSLSHYLQAIASYWEGKSLIYWQEENGLSQIKKAQQTAINEGWFDALCNTLFTLTDLSDDDNQEESEVLAQAEADINKAKDQMEEEFEKEKQNLKEKCEYVPHSSGFYALDDSGIALSVEGIVHHIWPWIDDSSPDLLMPILYL